MEINVLFDLQVTGKQVNIYLLYIVIYIIVGPPYYQFTKLILCGM